MGKYPANAQDLGMIMQNQTDAAGFVALGMSNLVCIDDSPAMNLPELLRVQLWQQFFQTQPNQ